MATKVLSNEFMQNIATEEAWKDLSSNFSWTEAMFRNICWTLPMIQKFQKKINWDRFSEYTDENVLIEPIIEAFKERWNWHELSGNSNLPLTYGLLEKYADMWDWERIIDSYGHEIYDKEAIEFYEKFKDYIPVFKIQNTYLWRAIVEQRSKQLAAEICM